MKIKVTQEHIDEGIRDDPQCCPVARALHEAGIEGAVGSSSVTTTWDSEEKETIIGLPPEACEFIEDFDDKKPVRPFSFELPWGGE